MKFKNLFIFVLASIMMFGCFSTISLAEDNVDYLDLETTTTKDIDQNYTFTQSGDITYTDVTKVKLTWTITDIEVTYTSNKTWDPDTLTWKETKTVGEIANKSAEFTLTNYSSKKVVGTVEFKVADDLASTLTSYEFDENNGKTIDTVVNKDHTIDETKKANVPSNTITATLEFDASKFAELTATTSATKYGTYTVTITAAPSKETQTISKPTATSANIKTDSITLTEIAAGQGATKYGINTIDAEPEDWEDNVLFTGLKPDTTYYFFAKYEGNDDYEAVVSESAQIKTNKLPFAIKTTLTNVTANGDNVTEIEANGEVTLKFTGETGYNVPNAVTVNGASYTWNASTGELKLSNPTGEVSVSLTGVLKTFTVTIKYVWVGESCTEEIKNIPYGTKITVDNTKITVPGADEYETDETYQFTMGVPMEYFSYWLAGYQEIVGEYEVTEDVTITAWYLYE